MDESLPQNPVEVVAEGGSYLKRHFVAFLLVSTVIILVGAYFPQILTRLGLRPPQKTEIVVAEPMVAHKTYDSVLQSGPFQCPTVSLFCQRDGRYDQNGLAGSLPAGSAILAAFDGVAEGIPSFHPKPDGSKEEFTLVLLTNKERGLQVVYYFKGTAIAREDVRPGDAIGQTTGEPLAFMGNKPFVFQLVRFGQDGGKTAQLSGKDFKP